MDDFFLRSVPDLARVVAAALLTYVSVVAFVRLVGKRSTSQLNNFDWIVTVAIGSIVASTIVVKELPLLEGLAAVLTLLAVQFLVTKLSLRWPRFSSLVHAEPTIVLFRGRFLREAMRQERITEQEVLGAIREAGAHDLEDVEAVVLETDAKFSVLTRPPAEDQGPAEALRCIRNYPHAESR